MTTEQLSYGGAPLTVRDNLVATYGETWGRTADATGIPLDASARDARQAIATRLDVRRYEE